VSGLRSALEEWVNQNLAELSVDQLADDLVELELSMGRLEAERARRLDAYKTRGGLGAHGYPSLTAFLIHRCRMATGRARRLVALATAARRCPRVRESWQSGDVSHDQAQRLLEVSEAAPTAFREDEEFLVDIIRPLSATDTRRALLYWLHTVTDSEPSDDPRGISLAETFDGGRVEGNLTSPAFAALKAALLALTPPPAQDDHRSARQRRHDALEDLARHYLETCETPEVGGERPHINVVCDLDALRRISGGRHETEDGDVLTVETLQMLACDSSVSRIVLGPRSEVIDVGRRTRVISAALRRAVIARDRHCTHPGCERPARWCDVHHEEHWADGGPTNSANCRLLCRYHHTLTHQGMRGQGRRAPPD
jgi:hypothetical protein